MKISVTIGIVKLEVEIEVPQNTPFLNSHLRERIAAIVQEALNIHRTIESEKELAKKK